MHPRLAELLDHADRTRAELLAVVGGLSPEQLHSPGPDGAWSVSQLLSHLHLVEQGSVRALFRAFRTARDAGLAQESVDSSLLGALDGTGLADGTRKLRAPDIVTPTDAPDLDVVVARLAESRTGLHVWAAEADGYALASVEFPHPRLGLLNLYQWVLMIADHERRHLRQIRERLDARSA